MTKLPGKCPMCGGKMDKGYVYHGGGIYWSEEKQRWFPKLERIAGVRFVRYQHFLEGYRCRNCKIVSFDYEKEHKAERAEDK